jgi:hypothetical protein
MHSCLPVLPTVSPPLLAHPAVFLVDPHGAFAFAPSHYVDITDFQDEKCGALSCHVSQEEAMRLALGYGIGEMSARLSALRGEQAGCTYAEAFVPMPARGSVKPYPVLP